MKKSDRISDEHDMFLIENDKNNWSDFDEELQAFLLVSTNIIRNDLIKMTRGIISLIAIDIDVRKVIYNTNCGRSRFSRANMLLQHKKYRINLHDVL